MKVKEENSVLSAFEVGGQDFFGENFLDGFLQYPWPGEWGWGGGGEESLQKPCKKVALL